MHTGCCSLVGNWVMVLSWVGGSPVRHSLTQLDCSIIHVSIAVCQLCRHRIACYMHPLLPCFCCVCLRSLTGELFKDGYAATLMLTSKCLPAIIVAMFGLRWTLMTFEAPLLSLVGPALNWKEVLFSALGGLRGGLALILAQTVLAAHGTTQDPMIKVGVPIGY